MPLFESFASFFANLSPRSQRAEDHQTVIQPEQPSTPPHIRLGYSPFTSRSDNHYPGVAAAQSADIAHSESAHSYVDKISSPSRTPITSQRSPTQSFHTVFDTRNRSEMLLFPPTNAQLTTLTSRRTSQSLQMVNKNSQKDSQDRQDEARLLGASYMKDPKAVKIKTGATMQSKKPGSNYSFSPSDKISDKSRMSGPFRGRARAAQSSPSTHRKAVISDSAFEESNRPAKRRRRGDMNTRIDSTATGNVISDRSQPAILSPPLQNPKPKSKVADAITRRLDEQKELENGVKESPSRRRVPNKRSTSAGSQDEQFTGRAAQQRRQLSKPADLRISEINCKPRGAVELHQVGRPETKTKKPDRNHHCAAPDSDNLPTNDRESPDELQGDITTLPIPKSLTGKSIKATHHHRDAMQSEPVNRKRSPSDIQPTEFSSPTQDKKKAKRAHQKLNKKSTLQASYCRIGSFIRGDETTPIHVTGDGLEVLTDPLGPVKKITFRSIKMAILGEETTQTPSLLISGEYSDGNQRFDIKFQTRDDMSTLLGILRTNDTTVRRKDMKHPEKQLASHMDQLANISNSTKKALRDQKSDVIPTRPNRRPKLSDQLRSADGELGKTKLYKIERMMASEDGTAESRNLSPCLGKGIKSIVQNEDPSNSDLDAGAGTEVPVEPLQADSRETRSRSRRGVPRAYRLMDGFEPNDKDQKSPLLEDDPFRDHWNHPLVYPPDGKKKAEVNLEDRDRLREDTYLNDNLIAFYMRFLQDHIERTNPDAAKRVYFFNSYFFTLLKTKGYKNVEKWTRTVDLFSYDYVLVPINESHHWYVAIICNLPNLVLENAKPVEPSSPPHTPSSTEITANIPQLNVQEFDEPPEPQSESGPWISAGRSSLKYLEQQPSEHSKEPSTRRHLTSLSIKKDQSAAEDASNSGGQKQMPLDEQLEADGSRACSSPNLSKIEAQKIAQDEAAASRSASNAKKKRTGPKLNPNQPTIVTFDSLDQSRSPAIRILREYISTEAKTKRAVEINSNDIKGMRGREIPLQPNFSDCGLYLLAYLEKFTQSPDWFITKILQRSMNCKDDWPPLGSGLLRYRLRTFLDDLYKEQHQTNQDSNGVIMAERTPIAFLLGPPLPRQEDPLENDLIPESQQEPQQQTGPSHTTPDEDDKAVESPTRKDTVNHSEKPSTHRMTLVLPEKSEPPKTKKASAEGRLQNKRASPARTEPVIQVPGSQEEPEVPRTPPRPLRAEARRKRQSPRGPSKE